MGKVTLKDQMLNKWRAMTTRVNPLPLMEPIPYKSTGSSYGACGIRIDGTPEFIDAVLSNLTDLIPGENCITRLELARQQVDGSKLGKAFHKAGADAEVCYIRLHRRGGEGVMLAAYDKTLVAATQAAGLFDD